MQKLELLAPAKNLECGIAAIDHGADAVYIGANRFGARAAAGNPVEDIAELCRYAHQFGAKVFVTVNTIIFDDELSDTIALVRQLDTIGVDAILIQDMGLYSQLKDLNLSCAMHASTQTDNRSSDKVKWLNSLGFKRIVLARELSIAEIAAIHREVPDVELEVFVHGALCVSYSGQCYASQYCFNRSANRGECAQFCRLAFTLKDANGRTIERDRHLLSLKDMAQLDNLELLAEAGAVSFKIEGRLKDVDYIKNVTAAYSQRLNEIVARHPDRYERASKGACNYTFTPDINKSFNRGFTTYFTEGKKVNNGNNPLSGMASFDTPKALGEEVGYVKEIRGNSFNVAGVASFSNGDGLCFIDSSHTLVGFRVNRVEGNRIFPLRMPRELRPGMTLYRNYDQAFNSLLCHRSSERLIALDLHLNIYKDRIQLHATDECGRKADVEMPFEAQVAKKSPEENIRLQLSKLGNTIYHIGNIQVEDLAFAEERSSGNGSSQPSAFIPNSLLSALKHDILENIAKADGNPTSGKAEPEHDAPCLQYPQPYLYNASNCHSKTFYKEMGIGDATSFEAAPPTGDAIVMQCRYCLRNELGYCTRTGRHAPWQEPLSLSLPDGRSFRLEFDCRNCQMNIHTR